MSLESVHRERGVIWHELFFDLGYTPIEPGRPGEHEDSLVLAAEKYTDDGERITISVDEFWEKGDDPQGLVPTFHGRYLHLSSWNAQIASKDVGQERRDVDRRHVAEEIHRHPLGAVNEIRVALGSIGSPDEWMLFIENILAERQGF